MVKLTLACIVAVFSLKSAVAEPRPLDNIELDGAIRKLYSAAWTPPPTRIDAVFYRERVQKPMSEAQVRKTVEGWFNSQQDAQDGDSLERQEEIEHNVRTVLKEQNEPRRLAQRVRLAGKRQRIDQVILPRGANFHPEIRLSQTHIDMGGEASKEGYKVFEYSALGRAARALPDNYRFAGTPVNEWILPPYIWIVRGMFGRVEAGQLVPDKAKFDAFVATGGSDEKRAIRVIPLSTTDVQTKRSDRLEFYALQKNGESRLTMVAECDHSNYSLVYRFELYEPTSGKLLMLEEVSEFGLRGVPVRLRIERFGEDGNTAEVDSVTFLKLDTEAVLNDDVFAFRPPPGYSIVDARQKEGRIVQAAKEGAAEQGETVAEALGSTSGAVVSSPASQPAGGS